ncbi:MAG: AAA family ATPase [Chloroflexota bacterium]
MTSPVTSPGFVGRAPEIQALRDAWARARDESPQIVIVAGEAGIGKTRLIETFAAEVRSGGDHVLRGGCLDLAEYGMPYAPVTEALRGFLRDLPPDRIGALDGAAYADLGRLLPGLGRLLDSDPSMTIATLAPLDARSGLDQARLFGLVLGLVGELAGDAALLVVLEDLHWVDRSTRDLITFLARNLDRERVLLLLSVRTDDLAPGHSVAAWLAGLERDAGTARLDLGCLTRTDVANQVAALMGQVADDAMVDRIHGRSEGNPFFVEELVAAERRGEGGALPRTLAEMLAQHVARLPEVAVPILAVFAVAGRPIGESLAASVLQRPESDIREAVRAGVVAGVLVADSVSGSLRPRHALLGEVMEAGLLPSERRSLHERFASVLGELPMAAGESIGTDMAELAYHWLRADRPEEAFRASITAGAQAEAIHAHAAAMRHYAQAIELESRVSPVVLTGDDLPSAAELRMRAARAADDIGDNDQAIAWLRDALDRVDVAMDPQWAGVIHSRLGYSLWAAERNEEAHAEHREAVRLVPASPPTAARARVLVGLGGWLMGAGLYGESRRVCEEAAACAVAAGAPLEEGRARSNLGSDLVSLGEVAAGIGELEKACRIGEEHGFVDTLLPASANLAYQLVVADRFGDALATAASGLAAATSFGLERRFGAHFRAVSIDALYRAGRWTEAEALAHASLERQRSSLGTMYRDVAAARIFAARGDAGAARERLVDGERLGVGEIDADVGAFVALVGAELALDGGDAAAAAAAVERGLAHLGASDDVVLVGPLCAVGLRARADMAEAARARRRPGEADEAEAAGDLLLARAEALWASLPPLTGSALATHLACRAEADRLGGASGGAAWSVVAAAWSAVPMPYPAAYAWLRAAEASLSSGDRTTAAENIEKAARTARDLGARPLLTAVEGLARRARLPITREAPSAPDGAQSATNVPDEAATPVAAPAAPAFAELGLSARESEVLALVAAGRTNGQIAQELFISPKTASVHVSHILDKLGVNSRIEAAMLAARAGLVAPDPGDPPP